MRLRGLVSSVHLDGREGVVLSEPLEGGRQKVRLWAEAAGAPAAPEAIVSVKPVNLLVVDEAAGAFARGCSQIAVSASALIAHLHCWWAEDAASHGLPLPPIVHIEVGHDAAAAGFAPQWQWRASAYDCEQSRMLAAGGSSKRGGEKYWLDSSPAIDSFVSLAAEHASGKEPSPGGDALCSGEAVFVVFTLARPDPHKKEGGRLSPPPNPRFTHSVILCHKVPSSVLRDTRRAVKESASRAAARLRGGTNALSNREAFGMALSTCVALCVEPVEGAAEAASVHSAPLQRVTGRLLSGDAARSTDYREPGAAAATPAPSCVLGCIVQPANAAAEKLRGVLSVR